MAEQRLPVVNADDGVWGGILREYLLKEHYNGDANVTAGTSTNGGHQFVTIRPGTSSAAPLTFAAGTNLSTPAAGSVEYDGTYYYLTTSSATRMQIVTNSANQTLTGKTVNLASNTLTGTMAQFNTAVSDGDIDYQLVPTAIKTSNYTAAANELVLVDCGASSVIVSLPTSPADGTKVGISTVGLSSTGKTVTMRATGTAKFNISIDGVFANWTDLPASIVTTVQYSTASQ